MARALHLLLVTPGRAVYDGDAESVVVPAADGMMGVLAGHAPFLGLLRDGEVSVQPAPSSQTPGPQTLAFPISGGTVQILADKVTILADSMTKTEG